jgi:hypothetical protein
VIKRNGTLVRYTDDKIKAKYHQSLCRMEAVQLQFPVVSNSQSANTETISSIFKRRMLAAHTAYRRDSGIRWSSPDALASRKGPQLPYSYREEHSLSAPGAS